MPQRQLLPQAAELIRDNITLALGGMTLYRRPVAFVRALLQRKTPPKTLTLLAFTAGYAADLLVGAGCVSAVRSVYFGLESFGFAPMFTQRAGDGTLRIIEETETSLVLGLRATAGRVPYLPSIAWQGTDLLKLRPDVTTITAPYTDENLTAFPAIPVDVAVIHALAVDAEGNAAINNNLAIDQLLVYAADTVIVTTETYVDRLEPTAERTLIPAAGIDYVCLAPHGAAPTSCYPLYKLRGREFAAYVDACATEGGFSEYLQRFVGESHP